MATKARRSIGFSFVHIPKDGQNAVSLNIDPTPVIFKKGTVAQSYAYLDIYDGGERKQPFSMTSLTGSSTSGTLATGLVWQFIGSVNGRMAVNLLYTGTTDIDLTKTVSVTYGGKTYTAELRVMTVADGAPGESVKGDTGPYCPPPQQWEDYPLEYEFQNGITDADGYPATRKDTVYCGTSDGKMVAYECIKSHRKGLVTTANGGPVNDRPDVNYNNDSENLRVWRRGNSYHLVSTEVLLAVNAYIKLLSSQGIRIYNSQSEIVGQMSAINGANVPATGGIVLPFFIGGVMSEAGAFTNATGPLFAVDTNGKTYHGGTSGQRIEIDPSGKRMLVYDPTGALCAIHSGEYLDWNTIASATSSTSTWSVTASNQSASVAARGFKSKDIFTRTASSAQGTLKISVPKFTIATNGTTYYTNPVTGLASQETASLRLDIVVGGVTVHSVMVGHSQKLSGSEETTAKEVSVQIPKGANYVGRLVYEHNMADGQATFTAQGTMTCSLEVSSKVCHYGRNGWYIATNSNNYSYCVYDENGKLHFKIVANGNTVFNTDDATKHF